MSDLFEQLEESAAAVRARVPGAAPEVALVLGSGLAGAVRMLESPETIPLGDVPNVRVPSVSGHPGRLLFGTVGRLRVGVLQGRLHTYEGWSAAETAFPVRLLVTLGARVVVLTNAAGGLDPSFGPGTLMVMSDHINLTGRSPLIGPNADELGPRFPDLTDAWSPRLRRRLFAAAAAEGIHLEEGVYVGLTGPNYETPTEVRMLARGGHAVGMSTVLECIAARWVGLEVCGVSLVTNAGAGYTGEPLSHEEVLEAGLTAGPRLAKVIARFVAELGED